MQPELEDYGLQDLSWQTSSFPWTLEEPADPRVRIWLENMAPLHVTSRHPEKKTTSDVQRLQKVIKLTIHIKGFGQGDLNSLYPT